MAEQPQKTVSGSTVRIWDEPKKRLQEMVEARARKERRPVSEAEVVSKAIEALYKKDKKKLGL